MIVAHMYPEGPGRGRLKEEDPAVMSADSALISHRRLQEARQLLSSDSALAEEVGHPRPLPSPSTHPTGELGPPTRQNRP
jgi:hypothetical protein